jgi:hypothetical protein
VNWFRLKACAKCKGDLVLDDGDWLCLQCGTYWYTGLYRNQEISWWPQENRPAPRTEKTQVPKAPYLSGLAHSTPGAFAFGRAPTAPRIMVHPHRAGAGGPVVRFSVAAATW